MHSTYAWAYMEALSKAEDVWAISFASDMPMKAEKKLVATATLDGKEVSKDVASVEVWVAPRIERAT